MGIINKERINKLDWEARSMEIVIVNAILDLKEKGLKEIKIVFDEYLDHDLYSDSEINYIIINGLSTSYDKHEMHDFEISLEKDYMLIKNKDLKKKYFNKTVKIKNKEYTITISDSAESDDLLDFTVQRQRSIPGPLVKTIKFNK